MSGARRRVSIVVAFHGARTTIGDCAAALLAQDVDGWETEIVLVDDGSTDAAHELLPSDPRLRLVRQRRTGPYGARNHGVRLAGGEVIAFTDADCIPERTWLAQLLAPLADPHVEVVLGRRIAPPGSRALSLLLSYEHARDVYVLQGQRPEIYYGHTNNMCVRRTTFDAFGPFVERVRGSDTIFVRRVVDGRSVDAVVYRPGAIVTHLELGGLGAYYRKVFMYGRHRRLTAALGAARPLTTRDRVAITRRTKQSRGGLASGLLLRALLALGAVSWWLGSSTAILPRSRTDPDG